MVIHMAAEKTNSSTRLESPTMPVSSVGKHGCSLFCWTDLLTAKELD